MYLLETHDPPAVHAGEAMSDPSLLLCRLKPINIEAEEGQVRTHWDAGLPGSGSGRSDSKRVCRGEPERRRRAEQRGGERMVPGPPETGEEGEEGEAERARFSRRWLARGVGRRSASKGWPDSAGLREADLKRAGAGPSEARQG